MTAISTGESYGCDANGNTLAPGASAGVNTRTEGGSTFTQTFDTQNRLTAIAVGTQTTQFLYDPDGNLVEQINPTGSPVSKTIYVSGIFEVDKNSSGTVIGTKTYYPAGGAMRITTVNPPTNNLYYVLKDHLGSTSVLTDASGAPVTNADIRYYPFGEARSSTVPMLTDKLFTGQREITGLGIYNYGTRFYSPKLGRFLSADTVTLGLANPQKLNHFSYAANNPLRYTDPTGHRACDNVDAAGRCITEPGGGLGGFGGILRPTNNSNKGTQGGVHHHEGDDSGGCVAGPVQLICGLDSLAEALTQPSSHVYTLTNVVCPASWHCAQQDMIYYLSLFAYPRQDPLNGPALPHTNYSVSPPFGWFPEVGPLSNIRNLGLIQVSTEHGGLTSINTTMKSHIFCCGTVRRTVTQDASGNWIVTTVGTGSNSNAFIAVVNQGLGPQLFQNEDTLMLIYIMDQKFPEPFPPE